MCFMYTLNHLSVTGDFRNGSDEDIRIPERRGSVRGQREKLLQSSLDRAVDSHNGEPMFSNRVVCGLAHNTLRGNPSRIKAQGT